MKGERETRVEKGRNMTIALDLMGGDGAPLSNIEGCLAALEKGIRILALGDEKAVSLVTSRGSFSNLETQVCSEIILPEESPVRAIKAKRDSTITQGLLAVKNGRAGAFVSAGSTGALVAGGVLLVGRAKGIDKPCMGTVFPAKNKRGVFVVDLGASSDVRPETLVEFGVMAKVYAEKVLGWQNPKVALLNIGIEPDKGNALAKKAYELMQKAPFDFCGNIEARDVFSAKADVLVTDGFTGNIFLKTCEGTATFQMEVIKDEITRGTIPKLAAFLLRPSLRRVRDVLDYSAYGGAPLLGLQGCVVKCHGSSDGRAIANGIYQAHKFLEQDVAHIIAESLSNIQMASPR